MNRCSKCNSHRTEVRSRSLSPRGTAHCHAFSQLSWFGTVKTDFLIPAFLADMYPVEHPGAKQCVWRFTGLSIVIYVMRTLQNFAEDSTIAAAEAYGRTCCASAWRERDLKSDTCATSHWLEQVLHPPPFAAGCEAPTSPSSHHTCG